MSVKTLVSFRQMLASKTINYSLLILVTMLGVVVPCWYMEQYAEITPLVLGVIAAALAETDDNLWGRFKALVLTFICFAIASLSIEILYPYPILFGLGLCLSTFVFIMLGAIGARYASIAFGSLLIAIYTMLGASESSSIFTQPILLLSGAAWYYLLSLIWQSLWPMQPVQLSLSQTFLQMSYYLQAKSSRFHPSLGNHSQSMRIEEARLNANTVTALDLCRDTFIKRSKKGHVDGPSDRFLRIYFLAQDIHERLNSSHYRYNDLASHFERSDVLFRFKHLLQTYAKECRDIAKSIRLNQPYVRSQSSVFALDELQGAMNHLQQQNNPQWQHSLRQLQYLFDNLCTVDRLLNNVNNPDAPSSDNVLDDKTAHTASQMWQRIRDSLSPSSMLFRHAVRLSLALTAGYAIIELFSIEHGFWILLTTLFVCQHNFSSTKQKLFHRISGTFAGLIIGVIMLSLIPDVEGQLFVIVISSVLFFAFRLQNYAYATAVITVLVLFLFSQLGAGYAVIVPRLTDTLVGSLLAVSTVYFILPDWQAKKIPSLMANTVRANNRYLGQIIAQYRVGKTDDLTYRISRRDAHRQDANLSAAISNMLAEPGRYQNAVDESFRFLTLSHALLSYVSALGAHRTQLSDATTHKLVIDAYQEIHVKLDAIDKALRNETFDPNVFDSNSIQHKLSQWRESDGTSAQMILQQLHLIHRMLPEIQTLSQTFSKPNKL
ncbi:TIGR01666 family membrane protein [Vibrio sp. UCD-FRSSP16_10]|uniref:YccS family putative transporter n=1 Tax=unclassified Vibrio TaxID=2614977 RepID=UPI0007FD2D93|nr:MULTISPECIES: YccS family putative transporter [unclassified Vibrio]OBT13687.1 TIGR01666 family membrane protein [Vibrio sp. UCD-FRSSP16_30]OBT20012.1 TIGR01666 family membrane protein [Vibrio sp. UCD-FRSSP16_10]